MAWLVRSLLLAALLLAGACSMETAINRMSSAEDRAFAQRFVQHVRRGDAERLKADFDSELWMKSQQQLPQARLLFPAGEGTTRLIGYHISANLADGVSTTTKDFVLVTTDGTHWTTTRIVTLAQGGPTRVVQWNVNGFKQPPPELEMFERMEAAVPWIQAGALLLLLAMIGLVWWLVRRSKRRAAGP